MEKILDINLIGSGRTDSGVHALGQVANVAINTSMSAIDLRNAINANINDDIFIKESLEVDLNFNSRFSAKRRSYIYKICKNKSPFINDRKWFNSSNFNKDLLMKCSKFVMGENNFSSFSKNNPDIKNKICTIYLSEWNFFESELIYRIEGNRFLHHMVRYLVGTMVEVSQGKISLDDFKDLLNNQSNRLNIFKAPAHGLYLHEVCYD